MLGKVFDTQKHSNVQRKAEYRRIGKYYKSLVKFKAEKQRRTLVLELRGRGLSVGLIAGRLGVSERTVKRDLARLRRSVKVQCNRRFVSVQSRQALSAFRKLKLIDKLNRIRTDAQYFSVQRDSKRCSSLMVTVDLDAAFKGNPSVEFNPCLPVDLLSNAKVTVQLKACGRIQPVARIYVGSVVKGSANLQTNLSMNAFIQHTLKGLKVVESSEDSEFGSGSPECLSKSEVNPAVSL